MAQLLRIIDKAKWYVQNIPWLNEGEIQSDALLNLKTESNNLSVFKIEDDHSNLDRIIAALGSGREGLAKFDYALIDYKNIEELNITIKESSGSTPDNKVNNEWHRDLLNLSTQKVQEIAVVISRQAVKNRILEKDIKKLITEHIVLGNIDKNILKPGVLKGIQSIVIT